MNTDDLSPVVYNLKDLYQSVNEDCQRHILTYLQILNKSDPRFIFFKHFKNDPMYNDYHMLYNFGYITMHDLYKVLIEQENCSDIYGLLNKIIHK